MKNIRKMPGLGAAVLALAVTFFSYTAEAAPTNDFTQLVKDTGSAVANVYTEQIVKQRRLLPPGFIPPGYPGFEDFFEQFERFSGRNRPQGKRSSLGSGFAISADGYIVTNNHVVAEADSIKVSFGNRKTTKEYSAQIVGTDPDTDLALLKIDATNLSYLKFGDSDALEVGEWVMAIGNPLGLDHSVTVGILSAKGRDIQSGSYDDFLQTDASINPGNSGGPLLNMQGEVIGINTAIASQAQGIGFAIPSSLAKKIIADLKSNKKVSRGWLGVTIQNVDAATAKALAMDSTAGALVGSVLDGQPAAKAGVKPGDVIIAVGDDSVSNTDDLMRKVALISPGTTVKITIWRNGKSMDISLTVAERESRQPQMDEGTIDSLGEPLGLTVRSLTKEEQLQRIPRLQGGLLITAVAGDSIARANGLMPGDIIISVNKQEVYTPEEFAKMVQKIATKEGVVLLWVVRQEAMFFRAIDLGDK